MRRPTTHPRRTARRERAKERAAQRAQRSDQEQLNLLIEGGHGYCHEAIALHEAITHRGDMASA